jgi:hypothetical protein
MKSVSERLSACACSLTLRVSAARRTNHSEGSTALVLSVMPPHHHGNVRLERSALDRQAVSIVAETDGDTHDFSTAGKEAAAFVNRHQIRHSLLEAQRKGLQVALRVRFEAAEPRGLHVEVVIVRHG